MLRDMWQLLKNHTGTITNRSAAFSSLGVKMPPSIFEANGNQSLRVLPAFLSPNALLSSPTRPHGPHGVGKTPMVSPRARTVSSLRQCWNIEQAPIYPKWSDQYSAVASKNHVRQCWKFLGLFRAVGRQCLQNHKIPLSWYRDQELPNPEAFSI